MRLRNLIAVAVFILALAAPAESQIRTPGLPIVPLGYCQLSATQLTGVVGLSSCSSGIPAGATAVALQAKTANVRYTDDGKTTPTATVGMQIISAQLPIYYPGTLSNLRFIAATGGSPILDVLFYR